MERRKKACHRWLFLVAADFAAVVASYYTTLRIRFYSDWGESFFAWLNHQLGVREGSEVGASLEAFYVASAFRIIIWLTFTSRSASSTPCGTCIPAARF
jgi:hypothetical protein